MTQLNPLDAEKNTGQMNTKLVGNASWAAVLLIAASLALFGYAISVVTFTDWEDYLLVGFPLVLAGSSLASIFIMRRGSPALGSGIIFSLNLIVPLLLAFVVRDTLWTASAYAFLTSALLIWRAMPRRSWQWAIIAASATLIVVVVVNLIDPPGRFLPPTEFNVFVAVLLTVLFAAFVSQTAQQAWGGSLRNKLVTAFIGVTVISTVSVAVYVYVTTNNILRNELERELTQHTDGVATSIGNLFEEQISTITTLSLDNTLIQSAEQANNSYSGDSNAIQSVLDTKDEQWRAADAENNNNNPLVSENLNNQVAVDLLNFQKTFPNHAEVFVTDVYGGLIGATNRTSDYYQADEGWWQAAYNDGIGAVYISEPEFDESAGALAIQIAMPLRISETGRVVGILRTTYLASAITPILAEQLGETGETDLFIPGEAPAHFHEGQYQPLEPGEFEQIQAIAGQGMVTTIFEGTSSVLLQSPVQVLEENSTINNLGWLILFHQDQSEALAPVNAQVRGVLIVLSIVLVLVVLAAFGLSIFLVQPIAQLTQTAEEIAAGNLDKRATATSSDEIGVLASTFNTMTSQLQETLNGLEQRVAARTRNLELAAQVGRTVSQVRSLEVMLKDASELILKEFNLYYVQVYLTDPAQQNLVLEAGTGDVGAQLLGRGHSLPLNTGSINGRAAIERTSVVISDTTASATFRKNPLLPETRAEMAVPLIVANKVVGVLDMQSSEPGSLNEEMLPAFEALAGQMAVAVQNANLVAEAETARVEVEKQARRLVRESWSEHLDAIHKPEHVGYMFAQNQVSPLADVSASDFPENGNAISAPISVTGESLGSLVVEIDDEARREQTDQLVSVVARQVAQQIENLRLLESAERYRFEAEKAARLQTVEGWQEYMRSRNTEHIGYLYDANEVRLYNNGHEETNALTLPVKAREENVGKLLVRGLTSENVEELELANVVAERLGAHIESLRLLEETKRGQVELDKRAQQLAAVAEISNVSSKEMDIQKMLESVVQLTQRKFGLYHAHVFIYDEDTDELKITACGYKEGDEHEGTHGATAIPMTKEQSLVARAARTKQAVIVNNVLLEPGWLPNPLLPDTASELAVPLVVGDRVLGVLDVQSDRVNAFTDEDANIQTTLASQVATALQNARSFTQAQKQAERESTLNVINQKIQSATSVEAVLQIAARELGHALGAPMTIAQLSMKDKA